MEKRTPHYRLSRVKELIRQGAYRVTRTALHCAAQDFSLTDTRDIATSVGGLASGDFYKSMTTYQDSRMWQDA
jgi:motility quorum-sensing regulator / GCU-specific mRNA interferase toxin